MNSNSSANIRLFLRANWWVFFIALILFSIGVVNLYSACASRGEAGLTISPEYQRQVVWGGIGLICLVVCLFIDYRNWRTLAWPFYIATIILLAAVLVGGDTVNGAKRWLDLGIMKVQPSEFAKISVLLLAARMLAVGKDPMGWIELIQVTLIGIIPAVLIFVEPDLGTTLNMLLILAGMILYRGVKLYILVILMVVLLVVACLSPYVVWPYLATYQQQRIMTLIKPEEASKDAKHNIKMAHVSIGSGQVWGNGYMGGDSSKLGYLPAHRTDFAVAVFGEEWGFMGCLLLTSLFSLFLLSIFASARAAKDRFGSMLCAGVYFYFFWQIFINMGMVLGLLPVVGIPLPFISYGGTTTLVNFSMVGLVLSVSMRRFLFKA